MENNKKYSMKDLVTEICEKKVYCGNDIDNSSLNAGNRISKVIRPKILPTLHLDEFIKEYEGNEQKPYNHEWIDFFDELLDAYEFSGTTKKENPGRAKITKGPLASNEIFTIRNIEIFSKLKNAIETGKEPEKYLGKLKKTKFYTMNVIEHAKIAILLNYKTLFQDFNDHFDELSGKGIIERLYFIQDNFESMVKQLELPFSPCVTKFNERI